MLNKNVWISLKFSKISYAVKEEFMQLIDRAHVYTLDYCQFCRLQLHWVHCKLQCIVSYTSTHILIFLLTQAQVTSTYCKYTSWTEYASASDQTCFSSSLINDKSSFGSGVCNADCCRLHSVNKMTEVENYQANCIFCKILKKEEPGDCIYEVNTALLCQFSFAFFL